MRATVLLSLLAGVALALLVAPAAASTAFERLAADVVVQAQQLEAEIAAMTPEAALADLDAVAAETDAESFAELAAELADHDTEAEAGGGRSTANTVVLVAVRIRGGAGWS